MELHITYFILLIPTQILQDGDGNYIEAVLSIYFA